MRKNDFLKGFLDAENTQFIKLKGSFEKSYRETGHVEARISTITEFYKSSVKSLEGKGGFTCNINTASFFVDSASERSRDKNLIFVRLHKVELI